MKAQASLEKYYPAFLNLKGKKCLVLGGGRVATRKVRSLLGSGAKVVCVSPTFNRGLRKLVKKTSLKLVPGRRFSSWLDHCSLAVGASSSREANERLSQLCHDRGILVNVVDNAGLSSFIVPSFFRRGPLQVAISTGGASPLLAKVIRKRLESIFGAEYSRFLTFMARERRRLIQQLDLPRKRQKLFLDLIDSPLIPLLKKRKFHQAKTLFRTILRRNGISAGD